MNSIQYGTLEHEGDLESVVDITARAFNRGPWGTLEGYGQHPRELFRLVRIGDRVGASLVADPIGQFFGGSSVPTAAVIGVAVDPQLFGQGLGRALLEGFVHELADRNVALSTLFPSTYGFYRNFGYEPAGGRWRARMPADRLSHDERVLPVRKLEKADEAKVRKCYRQHASTMPGHLDRSELRWEQLLRKSPDIYGVDVDGEIGAYGYVIPHREKPPFHVELADLVATNAAAARRMLTFLGDLRTTTEKIDWPSGPTDPFLAQLKETRGLELYLYESHWMLRIIDVARALAARGYPRGVAATLEFEVQDQLLEKNQGRFRLQVDGGSARVETGGQGHLKLDVRGLAPLFSSHLSPQQLEKSGQIEGPEADLEIAATVFAGPAPWMSDAF